MVCVQPHQERLSRSGNHISSVHLQPKYIPGDTDQEQKVLYEPSTALIIREDSLGNLGFQLHFEGG